MSVAQHSTYRALVKNMWADGRIIPEEVTTLTTMQSQLGISPEDAATIERDVMGQTKEEALVAGMGTNLPRSSPSDSQSTPIPGSSDVLGTFSGGRTFVSASDEQAGPRTLSGRTTSVGSDARSSSPGHLQAGDLVADRFEVLGILGEGGMGQVLKVRDTKLDAVRAMKVVRPELLHRGGILERFRHEVTTSQKLAHPNIVRVFDYDEDEARGIHFLTMELIDGMTLRKWLEQKRRTKSQVSLKEFTAISQGLCAALQYAHRFTVHRDLKPENIMLDRASRGIKLMDFGIAKAFGANKRFATAGPMGTVYYAAPEQERGEQVDHRADIYSMGVILNEVLSGEIPRAGSKPIGEVRSDVSANVAKAIETAMAASPTDRQSSASDFAKDLVTPSPQSKSDPVRLAAEIEQYAVVDKPDQEKGLFPVEMEIRLSEVDVVAAASNRQATKPSAVPNAIGAESRHLPARSREHATGLTQHFVILGWALYGLANTAYVVSIVGRDAPADIAGLLASLMILATCIMVGLDARFLGLASLRHARGDLSATDRYRPYEWVIVNIFLWLIFFPVYLVKRGKLADAAHEAQNYEANHPGDTWTPPTRSIMSQLLSGAAMILIPIAVVILILAWFNR